MGLNFSCAFPRIHELEVRATLTKMQFTDKAEELQVIHLAKWDIFSFSRHFLTPSWWEEMQAMILREFYKIFVYICVYIHRYVLVGPNKNTFHRIRDPSQRQNLCRLGGAFCSPWWISLWHEAQPIATVGLPLGNVSWCSPNDQRPVF